MTLNRGHWLASPSVNRDRAALDPFAPEAAKKAACRLNYMKLVAPDGRARDYATVAGLCK